MLEIGALLMLIDEYLNRGMILLFDVCCTKFDFDFDILEELDTQGTSMI